MGAEDTNEVATFVSCFSMETVRTEIRVRYGETDQMGVVYHSNYVLYFEVGRTEFMRRHGVCYADMEAKGMVLAVIDMSARFFRPALYDEVLTVETRLAQASGVRVRFEYRVLRPSKPETPEAPEAPEAPETKELLCSGSTTLACVNREGRPSRIQSPFKEKIESAVSPDC